MAVTHSTRTSLHSELAQGRLSCPFDVDQSRDVEDPKEAVVDEEGVFVEVVEDDEDQDSERPGDAVDGTA